MAMFPFCVYKVFLITMNYFLDKEAKERDQSLFLWLILIILKAEIINLVECY